MSAEGSPAGSWPLGQALRAYFLAFLPPDQVDEAVRQVGREAVAGGATGVLAVFAIASQVLHARVRLTPEVEALVLVDESRLLPDEAAMVLGLNSEQVEAVLAEAHAPLDGVPVEEAEPAPPLEPAPLPEPAAAVVAEPSVVESPEPAEVDWQEPPVPPALELPDHGLDEAELAEADEAELAELAEAELAEAELAELQLAELRETAATDAPAVEGQAAPPASPESTETPAPSRRSRRERSSGSASGFRGRAPILLGVALAALMAAGVLMTASPPGESSTGNATPTPSGSPAGPTASATPTAPGVPGLFDLRNAVLTDAVTDGRPAGAETTFTPNEDANLWIAFAYLGSAATDRMGVLWYRGEEVVFRDIFPLDQETGQQISTLTAPAKGQPGRYRADIFVNTQVVATVAFEVAT